ncbi:MAG: DUF308 domain-containing protein [Acidimicrobiaceae bacterium]|nr:DUF308 domain-containing protein [Acidimicrobiaceae bacterium]
MNTPMFSRSSGPEIPDVQRQLVRVSSSWGWFAFFGAVSFVVGILVLVWPGHTLVALAVLFGLQLVVSGLFRLVAAIAVTDATGGARALLAILGLLGLVIGLWALRHIDIALSVLALFLAIYWIIDGIIEIFTAVDHRELPGRGWVAVSGLLGIIAGIILLSWPGPSLLVLAIILGLFLLAFGLFQLAIGFGLRAAGRT